jgi:15-cis-phytoene synthase
MDQGALEPCRTQWRIVSGWSDRFLAALFAPAEHRGALYALYAFNLEIARVRALAHGSVAGEIRLQWWSDVLAGEAHGGAAGHPVAAALLATIARHRLAAAQLAALIDARRFDLYDEPMRTLADLNTYADATSSNLIRLSAQVIDDGSAELGDLFGDLAHHAGLAYAFTGLLAAFPIHARREQLYIPLEILDRHGAARHEVSRLRVTAGLHAALAEMRLIAREHLRQAQRIQSTLMPRLVPAFLPVALAGPVLARMERADYDPFRPVELSAWRRQWLIWRATRQPGRLFANP